MSQLHHVPAEFPAYVVDRRDGSTSRHVQRLALDELPPGDVTIRVDWSSVNYKDSLAVLPDGKVARIDRLVPGIDLAGVVVASEHAGIKPGEAVLAHGYEIGVARHGGYARYARLPAEWVVPLAPAMSAMDAMAIGTAGFTAALAIDRLQGWGVDPSAGPILVTGATGGVGRIAIDILASLGFEVWAATGKTHAHAELGELGAAGMVDRAEYISPGKPLDRQRWAAAIDPVGGPALPYILRTLRYGGVVAACGNAGGTALETTVFPFILRAVGLVGIDSVDVPIEDRRRLWSRLAADLSPRHLALGLQVVGLSDVDRALESIQLGEAQGRWVVKLED